MLQFSLTVNEQQKDGFKMSIRADSDKEMEAAKELASALIAKISKIEVSVHNSDYNN